ncbi:hypothetical protein ZWY2020_011918 [Hordeum vulgare]|nr:hypothetical protein ZWY2020_011918 [Hordeum vulgare]
MDASIGCQKAVQDLAGDNEEIREELWEIMGWFPSIEMMRNHVRGLIKVMREDEKEVLDEAGDKDKKKKREPKKKVMGVVRRSERLKKLQNN